jgi:nucleoside-diphosphate-sugar epimerase
MNQKVAVTGASGFLGRHVVENLQQKGFTVITLGRSSKNDVYFDLNEKESIITALTDHKPDFIVHLASPAVQEIYRSQKGNDGETDEVIYSEINGAYLLFTAAKNTNVKKVIYGSSAAVYGKNDLNVPFVESMVPNPNTTYGKVKLAVENVGAAIFPNLITLRFFQMFGRGDIKNRLVPTVVNASKSSDLLLTPCLQISDLIYVKDVAECIGQILLDDNIPPSTYNLGVGKPIQLRKVVELILKIRRVELVPNYGGIPYTGEIIKWSFADMTKLHKVCKWRPAYSLEEGISDMLNE